MNKKTYTQNGITFVEMPVDMLKVVWLDRNKNTGAQVTKNGNYCNANFFAYYDESGVSFRLPVAHLKCDIYPGFQLHAQVDHYMHERGKIEGNKFTFDSGKWQYDNPCYRKAVSTMFIRNHQAFVRDEIYLDKYQDCDYIISGVPVLRKGNDVKCYDYVLPQGWGEDTLRPALHVFIGVKKDKADTIYVMYYQSTSNNLIYGMEFYNKVKDLGLYDILKLDGGGSFIFKCPDLGISKSSGGTRIIDGVLTFDEPLQITQLDIDEVRAKINALSDYISRAAEGIAIASEELDKLKKMFM